MKTKLFFVLILSGFFCGCSETTTSDLLYLNANQLKPLGIELNSQGVFYKNENPNWKHDRERYAGFAFYCTNDNYVTTKLFNPSETLKSITKGDSLCIAEDMTKHDFYPLLIGDAKGNLTLDNQSVNGNMKLLPVAICMAETRLTGRKDTIVVWFKNSESLAKALPAKVNVNNYLRSRP